MKEKLEEIKKTQDSGFPIDELPAFDMGAFNPVHLLKNYLVEKISSYFKER